MWQVEVDRTTGRVVEAGSWPSVARSTGQYTIPLECLQPGYRHVPLQSLTGEELPHARLFVHVALTNRRGGGKPHKRGLSVRKARKGRDYTALRDLGVRAVDDVFKMAAPLLREATDLRENMQVGRRGLVVGRLHAVRSLFEADIKQRNVAMSLVLAPTFCRCQKFGVTLS